MIPTITVDARQAYARFSQAGIPEQVRNNLRRVLPDLGRLVGGAIDSKLDAGLKTRRSLSVKKEMRENSRSIYIQLTLVSSKEKLLPLWIEEGTKPHQIAARLAPVLYFFWEKLGRFVAFKSVNHPGTQAQHFVETTMIENEHRIVDTISNAVKQSAGKG